MDYTQFLDPNSINMDYTRIMDICKISYILDRFSIKENDKILDVGTGTGMLIPFVHQHNPKGNIKGIDKSKHMIQIAKEKFKNIENIEFQLADVECDTIKGTFDKIILFSVFPLLENKISTIKKLIENNLSDDGKLLIAHPESRKSLNAYIQTHSPLSTPKLLDIYQQRNIFRQAGLDVEEAFENDRIYYLILHK
ncbi:methyltransferase domain-containing protein [Intestinibacter bartlettii]|uniref:Class I SAM-dependent methyltransferase n=1 Tax=Intestinibacter bartlettii TaxID=261299 RepID=A0ABS6DZ39_9FIRM|nr:methyltransferase domain-containing protein [Intestinibacter bartlettii]MBU5337110.1 class I SAM-dependent methyltransferase [Intestinibacter bartlettii]MDO5010615.1 methyltransferase domain-containing protein [Intestinibacter bartlettii]